MNNAIKNIDDLPKIEKIIKICQGLALLDAIFIADWECRFFSFNSNWDDTKNEMMASMRDSSGSEYFILFSKEGAVGKVLNGEPVSNVSEIFN